MAPLNLMQVIVLLLGILVPPAFKTTGAQPIGVCNGRNGGINFPNEQETIKLYNEKGIRRMRLYDPLHDGTLDALGGTDIELILDVPNNKLESLQDRAAATAWVEENIINHPDVKFRYIAVGNEVDPDKAETSPYVNLVLNAMINVHAAIKDQHLEDKIKVSTATYSGLIGDHSSPPSVAAFKDNAQEFMKPIIQFLVDNNLPLLANIYPFFSYAYSKDQEINLEFALIASSTTVVQDPEGDLTYTNLFDAMLDAMYSAVEKLGGPNINIVVSESGWPSEGGLKGATKENAEAYYKNLIDHVKGNNGTPKKPGNAIETYLFAMFDENAKNGDDTEKHFGLFDPETRVFKYQLNFS